MKTPELLLQLHPLETWRMEDWISLRRTYKTWHDWPLESFSYLVLTFFLLAIFQAHDLLSITEFPQALCPFRGSFHLLFPLPETSLSFSCFMPLSVCHLPNESFPNHLTESVHRELLAHWRSCHLFPSCIELDEICNYLLILFVHVICLSQKCQYPRVPRTSLVFNKQ